MNLEKHLFKEQTSINIDGNYGNSFWLEYGHGMIDGRTTEDHLKYLEFALDSLFDFFGESIKPTSVYVSFGCCEPYVGEAEQFPLNGDSSRTYLGQEATAFVEENPYRSDTTLIRMEPLTKEQIKKNALENLLKGFACEDPTYFPGWGQIAFTSGHFLIEEAFVRDGICEVTYNRGHAWYDYPVNTDQTGNWVSAPLNYDLQEPVSVSINHFGYRLGFSVQLNWSYFYDDHYPGKKQMREAISRLEKLGWKLTGGRGFYEDK